MCSTARSCVRVSVVTGICLPGGCLSASLERLRVTWDSWSRQGTTAESLSDSPLLQQSHENQGLGISTIFYAESCGQVMAKVRKSMCKLVLVLSSHFCGVASGPLWLLMFFVRHVLMCDAGGGQHCLIQLSAWVPGCEELKWIYL